MVVVFRTKEQKERIKQILKEIKRRRYLLSLKKEKKTIIKFKHKYNKPFWVRKSFKKYQKLL